MAKRSVKNAPIGRRVAYSAAPVLDRIKKVTLATCSECTFGWIVAEGHEMEPDQSLICLSCQTSVPIVLERVTLYAAGAKLPKITPAAPMVKRPPPEVVVRGRNKDNTPHWSGCQCEICLSMR